MSKRSLMELTKQILKKIITEELKREISTSRTGVGGRRTAQNKIKRFIVDNPLGGMRPDVLLVEVRMVGEELDILGIRDYETGENINVDSQNIEDIKKQIRTGSAIEH